MKALIIDPALHSMGGHHYNAVLRLQEELAKLRVEHSCLTSAYADLTVMHELKGTPVFTKSVYGRTYSSSEEFAERVADTSRELSQALHRQGRLPDLLLLPCCDQVLALGVARHLKRHTFRARSHILLWILYGPHYKKSTDDPTAFTLYGECRDAFVSLKNCVGRRGLIRGYCETREMAQFYRALIDLDIEVMAGPGLLPARQPRRFREPGKPPTIACVGFANRPKGYRLLPEALESALRRHREARFLIHAIVEGSDAKDEQSVFNHLRRLGDRVIVRHDVLTLESYGALLEQADLLLLPYDPGVYQSRGSGVFTEASTLGIPVVATAGCAFAKPAFDGGWGVAIDDYSSEGVARAVLAAVEHLGELSIHAGRAARGVQDRLQPVLAKTVDAIRGERSSRVGSRLRRLLGARLAPDIG